MPEAEITRIADPIRNKMVFILEIIVSIGAAIIILVIGVARRMSNGITGPIEGLRAGVMRIGGGDLDYRLDVRTNDEIEELANAFNKMVCDLQTYVRDLKTTTSEKERFASELQVAHDSRRNPEPRSMRDGRWLLGWGMATATYPMNFAPARDRAQTAARAPNSNRAAMCSRNRSIGDAMSGSTRMRAR